MKLDPKSKTWNNDLKAWREQWNSEKVPGCSRKNCSNCSEHKQKKIVCKLQVAALRQDIIKTP